MRPHWIEIPLGVTKDELVKGLEGLAATLRDDAHAEVLHSIIVQRNPSTGATGLILRMESLDEMRRRASAATGWSSPQEAPPNA